MNGSTAIAPAKSCCSSKAPTRTRPPTSSCRRSKFLQPLAALVPHPRLQWKDGVGRARRVVQQDGPCLSCRSRDEL